VLPILLEDQPNEWQRFLFVRDVQAGPGVELEPIRKSQSRSERVRLCTLPSRYQFFSKISPMSGSASYLEQQRQGLGAELLDEAERAVE
jgi:hypothetical protein